MTQKMVFWLDPSITELRMEPKDRQTHVTHSLMNERRGIFFLRAVSSMVHLYHRFYEKNEEFELRTTSSPNGDESCSADTVQHQSPSVVLELLVKTSLHQTSGHSDNHEDAISQSY
jgi:hypothetical protein